MTARRAVWVASALSLCLLGAGCGNGAAHHPLAWVGTPSVFVPRDLPRDRIVIGRVRNDSNTTVRLLAAALRVRDAGGRVLESSAGFTASYAHGLFGAFQQPSTEPVRELVRLGRLLILEPGQTSPLFAAWRLPGNERGPLRIEYRGGTLTVPAATRPSAR